MRNIITRIIISLLLFLVIVYCIKYMALNICGSTVTGYIMSTTQRAYTDNKAEGRKYRNTAHYYFELDGKRYENYITYKTNIPIVRASDQEVKAAKVQYLSFFPYFSALKQYNDDSFSSYAFGIIGIFICIFGILGVNKVKFKKKSKKSCNSANWICKCGKENDEKYCDQCGKEKNVE